MKTRNKVDETMLLETRRFKLQFSWKYLKLKEWKFLSYCFYIY